MVLTTFRLSKPGLSPPVYIAGTFTEWEPTIEMDHDAVFGSRDQHEFSKTVDVEVGEHQYKFRLGHGDWWVVDDTSPTATDESGNVNNVIRVWDTGEPETKVYQANAQSLPVKEEKSVGGTSHDGILAKKASASSDEVSTAPRSVRSSAQATLRQPEPVPGPDLSRRQEPQDDAVGSVPRTNGVSAGKDKPDDKPSRSLVTAFLCCFSRKTALGVAAVSAVLVAIYVRR